MFVGVEELKEIMLHIKEKVESDPTLEVKEVITLIEKYLRQIEIYK